MSQNLQPLKITKHLTDGQLEVLELLARFRFATSQLIADATKKHNGTAVRSRLTILHEQHYIGRQYDPSYRLRNQFASYCLLPNGATALRNRLQRPFIDKSTQRSAYNDKMASNRFITHCLTLFKINNQLVRQYPDIKLFTKAELRIYDYFPHPLPDAYISLKLQQMSHRFFLELFDSYVPAYKIKQQIENLSNYYQSQQWQTKGTAFPTILYVCDTQTAQQKLQRQISALLDKSGATIEFLTTTNALLLAEKGETKIWTEASNPDVRRALKLPN